MKKLLKHTRTAALCFVALASFSCSEEDPITSSVTIYPELTLNGDRITVITEGGTYTEPGAQAFAGEQELEVTTTGTVDTSTPGVYDVFYGAENSDGFTTEQRRIVIVLSAEPSAINLEGTFFRNGNPNTITRISDRVYQANNAGGLALSDADNLLNVTFYNIDDERVYVPYQEDVSVSGIDVESNIGTIVNENSFNWVLFASAYYGTAVRNFTR